MAISPKAIRLIDRALAPLINSGCDIDKIKMVAAAGTELVEQGSVETGFGKLRVEAGLRIPRGRAYLVEEQYRGFAWVR